MSSSLQRFNVAVIGAGLAGASCARALAEAGLSVRVFDKSRGPGGRLATRRAEWVDVSGQQHTTRFDHGAIGLTARTAQFQAFLRQAVADGTLAEWAPAIAAESAPLDQVHPFHVPVPDMPALCRGMLEATVPRWSFAVDSLHREPLGWQLGAGGERHAQTFAAVVLALPPAQAAALLAPHQSGWAQEAAAVPMQPCWTLMGVEQTTGAAALDPSAWSLARPPEGSLAWVLRNDSRPGREQVAGQAHWVVHARADWSKRHLDMPADWVQAQMQFALTEYLGRPVALQHGAVHRWRYAMPYSKSFEPSGQCWWDPVTNLGVCGDFLGNHGAEGAWLSAQAMATTLLAATSGTPDPHSVSPSIEGALP